MSIATIPQAISRGDVSIYLCGNDNSIGSVFGGRKAAPGSTVSIAMVTDALRWGYNDGDNSQTEASIRETANYLVWLSGRYGQQAQAILEGSGGGSVIPGGGGNLNGDLFPLVITGLDFESDGVTYINPAIVARNIMLWVSGYDQEWQIAPTFFVYTDTGFKIVADEFDANNFLFIRIDKYNSGNATFSPSLAVLPIEIDYDLLGNDTLITNPTVTTAGQPVIISIKPNGFTYTWDTLFEFSDTEPETPSPIGVNTLQIYTFNFLASANKLVCVSQSLNVPI